MMRIGKEGTREARDGGCSNNLNWKSVKSALYGGGLETLGILDHASALLVQRVPIVGAYDTKSFLFGLDKLFLQIELVSMLLSRKMLLSCGKTGKQQ